MFLNFNTADNASANLDAGINASTGTITVTLGEGSVFPATNSILTLVQYNTPADPTSGVLKFEKILMTSRSSDILTVTRGYDGTTGTTFLSGDFVYLNVASKVIEDIQDEVVRLEDDKLDSVGGLRTGLTASSIVRTDVSGNEVIDALNTITPTDTDTIIMNRGGDIGEALFSEIKSSLSPSALVDQQFYAGEDLIIGDSVFTEGIPTFASATTALNISDISGNTRVSIPIFGNGVAMTTLKLALKKVGTPTQNINFRIETDNGSGSPSGTLFNANGTSSIAQGSLTTSFVDTTVTLGGSITIPAGQVCHIVIFQGTYGSETINNTHYYQIGLSITQSNSKSAKRYDGSSYFSSLSQNLQAVGTVPGGAGTSTTFTINCTAIKPLYVTSILKSFVNTWTNCIVSQGLVSVSVSFSVDTATFSSPIVIHPGAFSITCTGPSQSVITYGTVTPGAGFTSVMSSPVAPWFPTINISEVIEIPYVSSSGILSQVIMKTSARASYKLGSYPSFASKIATKGNICSRAILGEIAISGVIDNTLYYIGDVDRGVSSTVGVNSSKAGKGFGDGTLFIDKYAV